MMMGSFKLKNDEKRLKILEEFEEFKKKKDLYRYTNNNKYVDFADCFEFYPWLLKKLKNEKTIRKSLVLLFLYDKEFDKSFDKLKKFVLHPFKNKKTQDSISQKWHYYIAYYLLKEYWGKIGRKDGIVDFKNTFCSDMSKGRWCKDLKDWYNMKGKRK